MIAGARDLGAGPETSSSCLVRRARHGVWAVLDQGSFAGTNFVLNVLLARWLPREDYGAFVVVFSAMLFASGVYTALITEPLLIYGPRADGRAYLGAVVRGHWRVVLTMAAVIAGVGWILPAAYRHLTSCVVAMAAALPFIMCQWMTRRACYVFDVPRSAALVGGLYFLLTIAGAVAIERAGWMTPVAAYFVLGGASLCSALILTWKLRTPFHGTGDPEATARARADHIGYGRWAVGTNALVWARSNIYYFVLPVLGGLAASGEMRAAINLVMPMLHVQMAMGAVLLAAFSRRLDRTGSHRGVWKYVLATAAIALIYGAGIWVLGEQLFVWIYRGNYVVTPGTLVWASLLPIVSGVSVVAGAAVRAHARADVVFRGTVAASVATLGIGLPIVYAWGVAGAVAGLAVGYLVSSVAYCGWLLSSRSRGRGSDAPSPDVAGDFNA